MAALASTAIPADVHTKAVEPSVVALTPAVKGEG
jgi:hypothetical protein